MCLKGQSSSTGSCLEIRKWEETPKVKYIKIKNFRTKKFLQKNFEQKLSDAFLGISNKKLLDKYNIKMQAQYQKDVKTDWDSIININLQKVPGDYYIYKGI